MSAVNASHFSITVRLSVLILLPFLSVTDNILTIALSPDVDWVISLIIAVALT